MNKKKISLFIPPTLLALWLAAIHTGLIDWISGVAVKRGAATAVALIYTLFGSALFLFVLHLNSKKTWIVVASLVFSLVAGETLLRLFHPNGAIPTFHLVFDPQFHHFNPSSTTMVFENFRFATEEVAKRQVLVTTNSIGLRSRYEKEEFLSYSQRIIVLGDSFTFGFYVNDDEAFPAVLERELRRELGTEDLAVLNAGIVGSSPLLQRFLFDDLLKDWQPTLVISLFDATDVGDDFQYSRQLNQTVERTGRFLPTGFLRLLERDGSWTMHSALIQRLYPPCLLIFGALRHPWLMSSRDMTPFGLPLEIDGKQEIGPFFIYRYPLKITRPYFDATAENLRHVAEGTQDIGGRFVFGLSPRFHHWDKTAAPDNWEKDFYTLDEPYEFEMFRYFDERRDDLGFKVINLLPAFLASKEKPLVFPDDPHWTAAGCRVAAEFLADTLLTNGPLIPGPIVPPRSTEMLAPGPTDPADPSPALAAQPIPTTSAQLH